MHVFKFVSCVCLCMCVCVCTRMCVHACMLTCMCACLFVLCVCVCVFVGGCTYMHTFQHTMCIIIMYACHIHIPAGQMYSENCMQSMKRK